MTREKLAEEIREFLREHARVRPDYDTRFTLTRRTKKCLIT